MSEFFAVIIEAEGTSNVPAEVRLKLLLKAMARQRGLRCRECFRLEGERTGQAEAPARAPESATPIGSYMVPPAQGRQIP